MKKTSLLFSLLSFLFVTQVHAEDPAATADRMLDPTRNTAAFKDPKAFTEWSQQMMNPATSMALAQKGIDPNTYLRMVAGMMNPATLQNYMQLTDPSVAMKWMAAGLNPNFYTALVGQGLNPANYLPWLTAPLSPQAMNLGMQALNPAMYGNWLSAPVSPQALNTMMAPMNPNLYMNWLGAGMNPQTYGTWGALATNPLGAGVAPSAAAPAATAPAAANPFDPAALLKMLPVAQPAK
jgi:hypothetical protein